MITSGIANSITFKDLNSGTYPNMWNTLFANRRHGSGIYVPEYVQQYPKNHVIYCQFTSDSATVPELRVYAPYLIETVNLTLGRSISGTVTRYFFNMKFTLGAAYYDKKVSFKVVQGSDTLTSEPIYCTDISDQINRGELHYIKYSNLDRNDSDLSDRWIDWSTIDNTGNYMDLFIEGSVLEQKSTDESTILEGSQSKTIIAAKYFEGITLKSDGVPDYMAAKMGNISSMDLFQVNGVQYIKTGAMSNEPFGTSTLKKIAIPLEEVNTIGINVDDLGITIPEGGETEINMVNKNYDNVSADFDIERPDGYALHQILVTHAGSSSGEIATLTCGHTLGGQQYIDEMMGQIVADGKYQSFIPHHTPDFDNSGRVYFGISGYYVILRIWVQFLKITE